jgi:hypothetical protein
MKSTVLCLIDFLKNKNCISSKNSIGLIINLILGITLNIMLFVSFKKVIKNSEVDNSLIVSGYFIITCMLYVIITISDKIKNLEYVKNFFVLPIQYEEIFLSIILYGFFSWSNIMSSIMLVIPSLLFAQCFSNFIILTIESLFILIFIELLSLIFCEFLKCMKYSNFMIILFIIIIIILVLLVRTFYNNLIKMVGYSYLYSHISLISIIGVLLICFYKISQWMFIKYKHLFQNY